VLNVTKDSPGMAAERRALSRRRKASSGAAIPGEGERAGALRSTWGRLPCALYAGSRVFLERSRPPMRTAGVRQVCRLSKVAPQRNLLPIPESRGTMGMPDLSLPLSPMRPHMERDPGGHVPPPQHGGRSLPAVAGQALRIGGQRRKTSARHREGGGLHPAGLQSSVETHSIPLRFAWAADAFGGKCRRGLLLAGLA